MRMFRYGELMESATHKMAPESELSFFLKNGPSCFKLKVLTLNCVCGRTQSPDVCLNYSNSLRAAYFFRITPRFVSICK